MKKWKAAITIIVIVLIGIVFRVKGICDTKRAYNDGYEAGYENGVKMIYAAGNEIHKDIGVLWNT